jgi:hypothetical protein
MAKELLLPRKLMIRCDDAFLSLVDASLKPEESRSDMIRKAAMAEAERRQEDRRASRRRSK